MKISISMSRLLLIAVMVIIACVACVLGCTSTKHCVTTDLSQQFTSLESDGGPWVVAKVNTNIHGVIGVSVRLQNDDSGFVRYATTTDKLVVVGTKVTLVSISHPYSSRDVVGNSGIQPAPMLAVQIQ